MLWHYCIVKKVLQKNYLLHISNQRSIRVQGLEHCAVVHDVTVFTLYIVWNVLTFHNVNKTFMKNKVLNVTLLHCLLEQLHNKDNQEIFLEANHDCFVRC